MEGSLLRCQPVSWIKMTHLFTQDPHKVLLLTGRGAAGALRKGRSKLASALSRAAKSHYCRVWEPSAGYRPPLSG